MRKSGTGRRPVYVRLSVCHTHVLLQTANDVIELFSRPDSLITLYFLTLSSVAVIQRETASAGVLNIQAGKNWNFRRKSLFISKTLIRDRLVVATEHEQEVVGSR